MNDGLDEKTLIARAEDMVKLCEKQYSPKAFGFLTPAEAAVIKKRFKNGSNEQDIVFRFFGGYDEAERCVFLAYPDYAQDYASDEVVSLLEITGRNIEGLSHRDFLGSILGLGIKREKVGDILCLEDRCLVFVLADIADYIILNLDKVSNCGVSIKKTEVSGVKIPKRRVEELRTTVASLRLDSVIGAALKTSRAAAAEVIRAKRVSVNWQEADDLSAKMNPGDVFSVRGVGRFRLCEEFHETRKGRIGICIEKAI